MARDLAASIRRHRQLGLVLLAGGLVLALVGALVATKLLPPPGAGFLAAAGLLGVITSSLVLGGLALLARADPRWTLQRIVAAYVLAGLVVWLLSALAGGVGTAGELGFGVAIALLWPSWLVLWAVLEAQGLAVVV